MSVITLRGLNLEAEKMVRKHAAKKGKSMNRFIVELIEGSVLGKTIGKPREFDDLDDLLGSMSEQDVGCIEQSVTE
jgi:hypothetical protein